MFEFLARLGSRNWPVTQGEVTEAEVEEVQSGNPSELRLAIAYKFSIGADGPYTGEGFWQPQWSHRALEKLEAAERFLHPGHPVQVRYKPDDPSVNELHELDKLIEGAAL